MTSNLPCPDLDALQRLALNQASPAEAFTLHRHLVRCVVCAQTVQDLKDARHAAAATHEHIVTIHHVAEDRGIPYLVMQFLEGESLRERLDRERTLPTAEVLRVGREAAEGLAAAHALELIHRDVKPANIWL